MGWLVWLHKAGLYSSDTTFRGVYGAAARNGPSYQDALKYCHEWPHVSEPMRVR